MGLAFSREALHIPLRTIRDPRAAAYASRAPAAPGQPDALIAQFKTPPKFHVERAMAEPLRVITQTESWKSEVQTDVVEHLRALLVQAESGEIQGIAYSAATVDGMVTTGFTKNSAQSAIIGGLERVKHRMLAGEHS